MNKNHSYLDYVREPLREQYQRDQKVAQTTSLLRSIIRMHATFGSPPDRRMLVLPVVNSPGKADETIQLRLAGRHGDPIPENLAAALKDKSALVHQAGLWVVNSSVNAPFEGTAFTIVIEPPDVLGFDRQPLSGPDIDNVLQDLGQYNNQLSSC